jgi:hypothetical protein
MAGMIRAFDLSVSGVFLFLRQFPYIVSFHFKQNPFAKSQKVYSLRITKSFMGR